MIPIHELLNRIRWDAEFARGSFQLGYYDRAENRVILVPFSEVSFPPDGPELFQLTDAEGRTHRVPFHRVREVKRDAMRPPLRIRQLKQFRAVGWEAHFAKRNQNYAV